MKNNLGLIVSDNPISRAYINLFIKEKIFFDKIIYLMPNCFFFKKIFALKNFYKNNYFALKFLKQAKYEKIINQIENYFKVEKGFCNEMYRFSNLFEISKEIVFANDSSINSISNLNILKSFKETIFLNTGNEILKDVFSLKHKFIHIHPGYLPLVKGADGTLWHIKNHEFLGVTSFFMTQKIDEGYIISREKFSLPNFEKGNLKNIDIKTLYRFWFSFFDPLLRSIHLKKILKENLNFEKIKKDNQFTNHNQTKGNYYSFMKNSDIELVFKKIFK